MTGMCPLSPGLQTGVKGQNISETTLPGSPALWGVELHTPVPSRQDGTSTTQLASCTLCQMNKMSLKAETASAAMTTMMSAAIPARVIPGRV